MYLTLTLTMFLSKCFRGYGILSVQKKNNYMIPFDTVVNNIYIVITAKKVFIGLLIFRLTL